MIDNYEVKEFTQDTWADFDALFGKHKGVSGGCWCTFNLIILVDDPQELFGHH